MSWIAELDTHGREFPTCVHVTKTTRTMTHGATYVPIEDGKAARDENANLRKQMERLVTLLRNDCDIDANWDGLHKFWSIGLTDGGCLMRDRACKAEAENAKLRELLVGAFKDMRAWQTVIAGSNEWGYGKGCLDCLCKLRDAMQELGMEVEV